MSAPVDVLAVIKRIAETNAAFATTADRDGIVRVGESMLALQAGDLRAVSIAVAELIETLHTRRMEIGRRGGNTSMSPLRAEWEFLGTVLARVGGATANTMDPLHGKPFSREPVKGCPQPEADA